MSYACHGLFFREGMVLAEEVTRNLALGEDPLEFGKKVILERGWAEEVAFTDSGARVRGSIEAMPGGDVETCHRLRGILSKLLEAKTPHRVLLESDDTTVVIQEIGRRAMVVLVVSPERVVSDLDAAILRFAQAAAKDLD